MTNLVETLLQIRSLAQPCEWNLEPFSSDFRWCLFAKTPRERCSITIQNQQDAHAQLDGTIERRLPGIFFDFRIELMLIIRICTFGPIFSTEFREAADIVGPSGDEEVR